MVFCCPSEQHGIPPNPTLGFRSQHTLASLHGWYVAQRVGFHFAAVATSVVTAAVFAIIEVLYIRRSNPMWILIVPVIGGIAVGVCFIIAGQRADQAAISIETPGAFGAQPMNSEFRRAQSPETLPELTVVPL